MKCSACHRRIRQPALTLAGMVFGPVCAQKVLVAAGQIEPRRERETPIHDRPSTAQRDSLTRDLFEGVCA